MDQAIFIFCIRFTYAELLLTVGFNYVINK